METFTWIFTFIFVFFLVLVLSLFILIVILHYIPKPRNAPRVEEKEDIDIVVTWVDGNDSHRNALREQCKAKLRGEILKTDSVHACRFQDNNELLYMLRSVHQYAPWVRKIWIVTSGNQRPSWLNEKDQDWIEIVDDSLLFERSEDLPCFNSHAIECNLWKIPGLSEKFIYACDDMFFGSPTESSFFFSEDGKMKHYAIPWHQFYVDNTKDYQKDNCHAQAWKNNASLLKQDYLQYPVHQMTAMTKECMQMTSENFKEEWDKTISTAFRDPSNIHPFGLCQFYGSEKGLSTWTTTSFIGNETCAIPIQKWIHQNQILFSLVELLRPHLLCVNDDTGNETHNLERKKHLEHFFESYFPEKGFWEK